jgi:hypothetical protein
MNRYFLTSLPVYDSLRSNLDGIFGYPNGKADTSIAQEPTILPDGRIFVAICSAIYNAPDAADLIASHLEASTMEEIDSSEVEGLLLSEP